ncbi:hypothetical protein [Aromatoleum anaerobium]|uniref:Resolvase/invertase-type recombinase catalytic domain-containing protein n=1 Tax=Aromatoleum anaerobium TaxID=182180 RepID=A0ABX1PN69_9RHOO|nr:hypothetical protein [Aromatoleum anaerobium]MCK0507947.1 hypothetical protein [Aromatoleum anaerobium]
MRKPRLYSIQSRHARECEQVLSELLELAKAGRLTGLNWSAITNGREVASGRAGVMAHDDGLALLSSFRKAAKIADDSEPR